LSIQVCENTEPTTLLPEYIIGFVFESCQVRIYHSKQGRVGKALPRQTSSHSMTYSYVTPLSPSFSRLTIPTPSPSAPANSIALPTPSPTQAMFTARWNTTVYVTNCTVAAFIIQSDMFRRTFYQIYESIYQRPTDLVLLRVADTISTVQSASKVRLDVIGPLLLNLDQSVQSTTFDLLVTFPVPFGIGSNHSDIISWSSTLAGRFVRAARDVRNFSAILVSNGGVMGPTVTRAEIGRVEITLTSFNSVDDNSTMTVQPTNPPAAAIIFAASIPVGTLTITGIAIGISCIFSICAYFCCLKAAKNKRKIHTMMYETLYHNEYE
jgi:hypothetical protein